MKLTILSRLSLNFMAIILIVMGLVGYMVVQLRYMNQLSHDVVAVDSAMIRQIVDLHDAIYSQVGFEKKYLISQDKDFAAKFWELSLLIKDQFFGLKMLSETAAEDQIIDQAHQLHVHYERLFKEEEHYLANGKGYAPKDFQKQKEHLIENVDDGLKEIMQKARANRESKFEKSIRISQRLLEVTLVTAGLILFIGFVLSFLVARSINRSIWLLKGKTKEIAQGQFEKIQNISSPPEIKELADDFNRMCDRLKELDTMKIDFISHVSHELRTPLTAIKEATSMLLEGVYADQPEKQTDLLRITKEECQRLITSVNKILDLSRMEADMMEYAFSRRQLAPIVQKNISKMAPLAHKKSIQIELLPPPELPLIRVDPEKIEQVVENLLGNAIKYTPAKGRISITLVNEQAPRKMIRVSIKDTGPGIAADNLEKIFDKFRRIEHGKETARGTGLGLAITKHIVTAHGGLIWVESTPREGSTFIFTLPMV